MLSYRPQPRKKTPTILGHRVVRICAMPFAALFAVSASAAVSISWTNATDAVWITGGDWTGEVVHAGADMAVYDASAATDLNIAISPDTTIPGTEITTPSGLIAIGGMNALTLSAGEMNLNGTLQDLQFRALVALAAGQSRTEEAGRTLMSKELTFGAKVNLNKIGFGEPALSSPNIYFATTANGDEALNVKGSLSGANGMKLPFTNFGTLSVAPAPRATPKLESVRFNNVSGVVQTARNAAKSTAKITKQNIGANEKVLTSGEAPSDFTASLTLQHNNGVVPAFEGVTSAGVDAARDLDLHTTNIVTTENLNVGHQYQLSSLTPQASPPASGLLSVSFTFGYGFRMENANGSGPGAISNYWNHVNAYPMTNKSLQFDDVPPPPAPAVFSESYFLNGANRGKNTFLGQNGHMVRNIGWDKNNLNTLLSDGTFLPTPMTFTYDDPATISAFAHNSQYGSGPVIESGPSTQPYNQRQLRWTGAGDSGGSISYFEFGNIPVDRLGGLYSVYLQGSGFVVPQLTNLTSPTLRLQTPGKAGTLILSYIQFVAVPTTIYWTGASTPTNALWSNSNNLSTDSAGLLPLTVPLANFHSVVFNAANAVNFQNTTLGADQTIQTLKFASNATTPVSIGGGTNTLTIVPTLPTTGVTVETLSANHIISSKIALGAAQTWTVTDANQILTMSGVISGDFAFNKAGAGTLLLTGQNTSTGATTINAGTLQLGDGGTSGSISKDSALTVNGTLVINRSNNTIQGVDFGAITGTGGLTQNGSGSTTLSLVNSYTGGTTINAGTLVLNGTITGTTTVNNGCTLAGDNSTMGNATINNGGTFSPGGGSAIGALTLNGDLALNTSSIFTVQFDSTAIAVDAITLNGNLNIASGAVLNVSDIGSNPINIFDVPASVITYTGAWNGGIFAGLPDDSYFMSAGQAYQISYDGGAVTLTMVAAIPEPCTAVSLLGGLGILLGMRRRSARS